MQNLIIFIKNAFKQIFVKKLKKKIHIPKGLSNYPILCTPTDPFQQAAAAFVWPSYIPQGTTPATLQPPPNFIFPSMSPHSTLQAAAAAQPYATSLQLLGSNYLTAAAAAAAAAAATSTLCQHNQQTNSTSSSINLSLGGSVTGSSTSGTTMSSTSSSTTTRFMSLATTGGATTGGGSINDTGQTSKTSTHKPIAPAPLTVPQSASTAATTLALANGQSLLAAGHQHIGPTVPPPLLIPPSALKMEEWSSSDFMTSAASKTTTTTLTAAALNVPQVPPPPPPPPAHYEHRDKNSALTTTHSATNLLELTAPNTQALNLMRLPTPPTSATMESAAVAAAAAAGTPNHLPTQLLFQTATPSPPTTLLNLSATLNRVTAAQPAQNSPNVTTTLTPLTTGPSTPLNSNNTTAAGFLTCPSNTSGSAITATIGPPTPLADDIPSLHFKTTPQHMDTSGSPQIVVGVPRVVNPALPNTMPSVPVNPPAPPPPPIVPQMQDVNIQTDTPVCSEDENSSCPLNATTTAAATAATVQCNGANSSVTTEQCTTAQCTPPLTQNDELYHDTEAQQPLELTKPTVHHRSETPQVESSSQLLQTEEQMPLLKSPIKQQTTTAQLNEANDEQSTVEHFDRHHQQQPQQLSLTPTISSSTATPITNPEDLTGLELLSNISTSTLAKTATIRVKQEPLDPVNETSSSLANMCHLTTAEQQQQNPMMELNSSHLDTHLSEQQQQQQQNSLILHAENLPTPASPTQPQSPSISQQHIVTTQTPASNIAPSDDVEPLGGLKLLCALAEQRIQEEEEVQSTTMSAANGLFRSTNANSPSHHFTSSSPFTQNAFVKPLSGTAALSFSPMDTQNSTFPSMETLELPSTSTTTTNGNCFSAHLNEAAVLESPVKRKKHKHSKSSKSSSSVNGSSSSKKSQKCSKKNKKKYSKEKKRHKLLAAESQQADLDFDDPQLQQELQNAFQNCVDPSFQRTGKWPTPQEIFSIMENSMRMRLADITRQYRKKKRKLDEISKNKKNKKKCSKLQAAQQQISLVGNSALSLAASERTSSGTTVVGSLNSSPLCDYKFGNFSTKSSSSSANTSTTNYLAPSSFIRFATETSKKSQSHHHHHHHHHHLNTHPQFPPPPDLELENDNNTTSTTTTNHANTSTSSLIYKPVRLEPSSLDQRVASGAGSNGVLRLAQKHASSEKHSHVIVCKEPKLSSSTSSRRSSGNDDEEDDDDGEEVEANEIDEDNEVNANNANADNDDDEEEDEDDNNHINNSSDTEISKHTIGVKKMQKMNPIDRSLMLTQEHLYREETRVLTDMGGLFYAGIMKPLQPPDIYAITLDGERGNKSHIMSREEIFKDTVSVFLLQNIKKYIKEE